jgi:hypothetical protein
LRLNEYIEELEALLEAPYSQYVGAMGRPDADYVGQAYKRKPIPLGGKKYPYDRNRDMDSWEIGRDRGSGDREPIRVPLTAKTKGQTNKSGFEEASGTPMNFTMSGKGGSMLGNPAPGADGGWASDPIRPDDDDEEFLDAMQTYGDSDAHTEALAHDPVVPPVEEPAVLTPEHWEDQSDTDLEKTIDRAMTGSGAVDKDEPPSEEELTDFDSFPSVIMQMVGSGFGTGLGATNPSGRGFMNGWAEDRDVLALESAWAELIRLLGMQ